MPLVLPFLIHAVGPKGPRQGIGSPSQEIGPPSQEVGLQEAQRDCADGRREQACSHRPGQCFDDDADSVSRRALPFAPTTAPATSHCPDHGHASCPWPCAQGMRMAALVAAIALTWCIGSKEGTCPVRPRHRTSSASGQNASRQQTCPAVGTIGKARWVVVMLLAMSAGALVRSAAFVSPH